MRHGRRMGDQALDATERLGQREHPERLDEAFHRVAPARQLEAQHGAEPRLLGLGQGMSRMRGQARIMHAGHRGMRVKEGGQGRGVLLLLLDPDEQGAQAPQGQIGVQRRAGDADRVRPGGQFLAHSLVGGDHRPADDVGMAVQELGGGVDDEIRPEGDRLLQGRRQEGVVDHRQRAHGLRVRGDAADIHDPHQRVARRLDEHDLRPLGQRRRERVRIGLVDEGHPVMAPGAAEAEQAVRPAVAIVGGDEQVARPQARQGEVEGRHAAGDHDGPGAALELGDRVGQRVPRRVAEARVIVGSRLLEGRELEGRRQVDRRDHGPEGRILGHAVRRRDGAGR